MTLSVLSAIGVWSKQAHDDPIYSRLSRAIGGSMPDLKVLFRGDGDANTADFIAQATTTAAETGQVLDLTDKLVDFPANTKRKVKLKYYAQDGEDRWSFVREYEVLGGTTPVITGGEEIQEARAFIAGAAATYGRCHAATNYDSSDTATQSTVGTSNVGGASTAGSSIGNISTNTATLTHPIARATPKRVLGVNASADVATATEQLLATVFPVNATTMSIFTADTATPSADGFDDDGRLEVDFYIEPPPNAFLTMNSNNVEVHVSHDASDNVLHTVEVFVGPAVPIPFQA